MASESGGPDTQWGDAGLANVAHDSFEDHREIEGPSDRSFGFTVGGILIAIAIIRWIALDAGATSTLVLSIAGALLVLFAAIKPAALAPLNHAWGKLGLLLASIVNPVIVGLMFVLLFVPMSLAMRLFGRDALGLKRPANAQSYWISRAADDADPKTMRNQF